MYFKTAIVVLLLMTKFCCKNVIHLYIRAYHLHVHVQKLEAPSPECGLKNAYLINSHQPF